MAKIGFDVAGEYLEFVGHCLEAVMDSRGDLEVMVSDQPGRSQLLCLLFLGRVVAVVAECRVGRFVGECGSALQCAEAGLQDDRVGMVVVGAPPS